MPTAEEFKTIGNDFYSNHDFEAAIMVSTSGPASRRALSTDHTTNTELFSSVSLSRDEYMVIGDRHGLTHPD
jgi:spore germination protein GerM